MHYSSTYPQVTITAFVEIYYNIPKRREITMFHHESTSYYGSDCRVLILSLLQNARNPWHYCVSAISPKPAARMRCVKRRKNLKTVDILLIFCIFSIHLPGNAKRWSLVFSKLPAIFSWLRRKDLCVSLRDPPSCAGPLGLLGHAATRMSTGRSRFTPRPIGFLP